NPDSIRTAALFTQPRDQAEDSAAQQCWLKLHTHKQGSEEPCCRSCVLISWQTLCIRLVFLQPGCGQTDENRNQMIREPRIKRRISGMRRELPRKQYACSASQNLVLGITVTHCAHTRWDVALCDRAKI